MSKISYYGYTISPNQIETGEGFLICRNVPIARTGDQDYLESEVIEGGDPQKVVKVHRPEAEVFSDAVLASFEGKPFTNDHPPVLLDPKNVLVYEKGHVQNVRRGSGEWDGYMIADLHVHDAETIDAIKGGKRQISCGYECEYTDNGDSTYTQSKIRGNHVALVDLGRAGHKAAIMDSNKVTNEVITERTEKKMSKKSIWSALFAHAAEGKTADEIAKLAMDSAEVLTEETVDEETTPSEPEKKDAKDEDYKDKLFESIDALNKRLDAIEARLPQPKEETKDEDPVEVALKAIESLAEEKEAENPVGDEDIDSEEAHVVPAEEMDGCKDGEPKEEAKATDSAFYKNLVSAIRPAIASIKDANERKAVVDALTKTLRDQKNDSVKIMDAMATAKKPASKGIDIEAIQSAYDACNPHLRKETK